MEKDVIIEQLRAENAQQKIQIDALTTQINALQQQNAVLVQQNDEIIVKLDNLLKNQAVVEQNVVNKHNLNASTSKKRVSSDIIFSNKKQPKIREFFENSNNGNNNDDNMSDEINPAIPTNSDTPNIDTGRHGKW